MIQCGRFDKPRLFHLADLHDDGTDSDPLRRLRTSLSPMSDLSMCFSTMRKAIITAWPHLAISGTMFVDHLEQRLTLALRFGINKTTMSTRYAACMTQVVEPVIRYITGHGDKGEPCFDGECLMRL